MVHLLVIGSPLDGDYLTSLSTDAVPGLVQSFAAPSLSPAFKDDLSAVLSAYRQELDLRAVRLATWQSFNFSDWNATRQMQGDFFMGNPS